MHSTPLVLIGLAALGSLVLIASALRRARQAAYLARDAARSVSLLGRVLATAGVITGGQYLMILFVHNTLWVVVALALPALLAALATVRATTATGLTRR
jgi:hypothetical protein